MKRAVQIRICPPILRMVDEAALADTGESYARD
jgi:hypothetical protein